MTWNCRGGPEQSVASAGTGSKALCQRIVQDTDGVGRHSYSSFLLPNPVAVAIDKAIVLQELFLYLGEVGVYCDLLDVKALAVSIVTSLSSSNFDLYPIDSNRQIPIIRVRTLSSILMIRCVSLRQPRTIHRDEDLVRSIDGQFSRYSGLYLQEEVRSRH